MARVVQKSNSPLSPLSPFGSASFFSGLFLSRASFLISFPCFKIKCRYAAGFDLEMLLFPLKQGVIRVKAFRRLQCSPVNGVIGPFHQEESILLGEDGLHFIRRRLLAFDG